MCWLHSSALGGLWSQNADLWRPKNVPTLRINSSDENEIHFLTLTIIEWIEIFTASQYFHVIIDCLKYCQQKKGLILYEYVILPNHLHLIAQAKSGYKLSQIVSDFKKHTTREILKLLKEDNRKYILNLLKNSFARKQGCQNQIWQRENYPEIIQSEAFYLQKANYIHNNPVKRGYVLKPEDWVYSSARNRILNDQSMITLAQSFF